MKKTDKRISLEKIDLISFVEKNTLKDIAKKFNSSVSMIHTVLDEKFKSKKYGFKIDENEEIDAPEGAWMNSCERKSLAETGYFELKK